MSFGLHLSLWLLIAGCAEQALVVPDSDWRTVPPAQRAAIDKQQETDLAAAQAELAAASASLAAYQRAPAPPRATLPPGTAAADSDAGDAGNAQAVAAREKARTDALTRVEAAVAEVQRADLAWRRLRVDAARARIAVVVGQRELSRAQAIDHSLPGTDHYEVAPLRGQFSRAQQRWYAIANHAGTARDAFEHASTALASVKEAYAQLMRGGTIRPSGPAGTADDHSARLELPSWAVTRSDIRRRRGLRHLLDEAGTAAQLHKVAFQLSPVPHTSPSPSPAASAAAAAPARSAEPHGTTAEHPADRAAGASLPSGAVSNAAAPPRSPAATTFEHPADRAAGAQPPAAAVSSNARPPAAAPRGAPLPAPKTEHPAAPITPSMTVSARSKPGEPPRSLPPAKPAEPSATASVSPPAAAAHPAAASAPIAKPAAPAPRPPQPAGTTSAAKPVERPLSEADSHSR